MCQLQRPSYILILTVLITWFSIGSTQESAGSYVTQKPRRSYVSPYVPRDPGYTTRDTDNSNGCLTQETLVASSGTVSSPAVLTETGYFYESNLDHCWLIRTSAAVVIKFTKFELESGYDFVHIYENTESPVAKQERFRLTGSNVTASEFWLTGTTLVRFRTDNGVQLTGFTFTYRRQRAFYRPNKGGSLSYRSLEVIQSGNGSRQSHPAFGSGKDYPNNLARAWSIQAADNQPVLIRITNFSTPACCDWLRFYAGVLPNAVNTTAISKISGSRNGITRLFFGSVSIVFNTGRYMTDRGFSFDFTLPTEINGCEFVKPGSARIDLVMPELWHMNSWTQFSLTSIGACDSNRHLECELRFPSGGWLVAQKMLVQRSVQLSGNQQCMCLLESRYLADGPMSYPQGSRIKCSLQDLDDVTYQLPHINLTFQVAWNFSAWSHKTAQKSFGVFLKPKLELSTAPTCVLRHACDGRSTLAVPLDRSVQSTAREIWFNANSATCIKSIGCRFNSWVNKSIAAPAHNPESLRIELVKPELWSLTGVTHFRAVSDVACGSVKHRCDMKLANGTKVSLRQVDVIVSAPTGPRCQSSVTTHFMLLTQPWFASGATISCRLLNGSFVEHVLPPPGTKPELVRFDGR